MFLDLVLFQTKKKSGAQESQPVNWTETSNIIQLVILWIMAENDKLMAGNMERELELSCNIFATSMSGFDWGP